MFFPWELNAKPYFVHDKFKWYVDKFATDYVTRDRSISATHTRRGMKNVGAFYVREGDTDIHNCVLIDDEQNIICEDRTSIGLCDKAEKLIIWEDFVLQEIDDKNKPKFEDVQLYLKELYAYNNNIKRCKIYTHPIIKELFFDENNSPIS